MPSKRKERTINARTEGERGGPPELAYAYNTIYTVKSVYFLGRLYPKARAKGLQSPQPRAKPWDFDKNEHRAEGPTAPATKVIRYFGLSALGLRLNNSQGVALG